MLELMPPFYFLTFAKVSVSVSKKFGLKKVSVSVSKTFGLEKKSRYRSRKHLVSKKSLGIGLKNIWSRKKVSVSVSKILVSKKSLGIGLDEFFWSRHSVLDRCFVTTVFSEWFLISIQNIYCVIGSRADENDPMFQNIIKYRKY